VCSHVYVCAYSYLYLSILYIQTCVHIHIHAKFQYIFIYIFLQTFYKSTNFHTAREILNVFRFIIAYNAGLYA